MPISKRLLTRLIDTGKINISPYNSSQLIENGYKLKCSDKITKFGDNDTAYLYTANEKARLKTQMIIPDNGIILEPRRIYELELVETVTSENYSIQIVPAPDLATAGITLNVSSSVDYNPPGKLKITLTSIQPVTIYKNQVVAMAYFTSAEGDGVPSGGIIMWSGSDVPTGWLLCDGNDGTPDLRDRFVLGWGSRGIGDTGGVEKHTLTVDELPAHDHSSGNMRVDIDVPDPAPAPMSRTNTRAIYGAYVEGRTGDTGGGEPHENMPPYYVLAFIMKE